MNRRDFLKRIAAAGLVAATPEILVPERRFWQLDQTMTNPEAEQAKDLLKNVLRDMYRMREFFADARPGGVYEVENFHEAERELVWWDGSHVHRGMAGTTQIDVSGSLSARIIGIAEAAG